MKIKSSFFILLFCMTSSLTASSVQTAATIVDKAKEALYDVNAIMTSSDGPPGASVCFNQKYSYTSKQLDNDAIKEVFDTLGADITLELMKESLNTHTQFFKAYHRKHPYVLYGMACICTVSIAHSLYTVINKMRKKQT
jgi:hypothetical protein